MIKLIKNIHMKINIIIIIIILIIMIIKIIKQIKIIFPKKNVTNNNTTSNNKIIIIKIKIRMKFQKKYKREECKWCTVLRRTSTLSGSW